MEESKQKLTEKRLRRRVIALTGFMGTGKTSVGRRLADRLGWSFVDTDVMIETREQRSVADIFAAQGEAYFRAREREAIAAATALDRAVVATGGGALLDEHNFDLLNQNAFLVCLTARAETILMRTSGHTRPLLAGEDRGARVRRLLAERAPVYGKVEHTIDTSNLSLDQVVDRIVALAESETPSSPVK